MPHTHRCSHAIEELRRRPNFWNVHGGHRWETSANTMPLVMTLGSRETLIEFAVVPVRDKSGRLDQRRIFNTRAGNSAQILRVRLSTRSPSARHRRSATSSRSMSRCLSDCAGNQKERTQGSPVAPAPATARLGLKNAANRTPITAAAPAGISQIIRQSRPPERCTPRPPRPRPRRR